MNYFSAENLSKSFGDQILFEGLSFGLSRGDKVALVARNGAGKTTLLRILMGKMDPDTGEYTFRSGLKSAFLEQAPDLDGSLTIDQLIATTNTPVLAVIRSYEKALDNHAKHQNSASDKNLQLATNKMDQVDAWDYERRLKQLLDLFRVSNTTQKVSELSGGEKKRLALAMILLDKPDILILDEPTNHLDIQMIEWLEQYLSQTALTLLMVTHDRYFLDRVCNRIIEISLGKMYQYHGNYGLFLQKRAEREEITRVESVKAGQLMKKELEWLNRMPKARTGKSKARIDAFDGIKERANMLTDEGELTLRVKSPRLGTKILEIDNVSKAYGSTKILDHFSYKFAKGERLGIIGRNGTGKTAFLDVISGVAGKDQGTIERGKTLEIGYYRQMGMEWRDDQRVIDAVKDIAEVVSIEDGKTISASRFLEHFMFTPEAQYKMISKLSGGELRRLHLLTVLIKNPNFLILDEPTNDLDLFALNRLEEFLLSFKGCLVIVSHDRYFLDKLTDHIFIFEGGGEIKDHYGTYSSYRPSRGRVEIKDNTGKNRNADRRKKPAIKTKLTFSEQQEYEQLEADIEELENEKSSLEAELSTRGLPYEILEEKSKRAAEIIDLIESKLNRWMDLGQYVKD
ncbi:MAG: ABC-F family ATP-binding cassette domain-containing protein [Bacteroidota bacterium]